MSSRSTRSTSTRVRVSVRSTIRKTKGCHVLTILSPVRCPFDMADVGKPFGSQQRLGDISRSAANAGVLFEPHGRGFQGLLRGRRRRRAGWLSVNGGRRTRWRQRQPSPSKPATCHVQSIISSVPETAVPARRWRDKSASIAGSPAPGRQDAAARRRQPRRRPHSVVRGDRRP